MTSPNRKFAIDSADVVARVVVRLLQVVAVAFAVAPALLVVVYSFSARSSLRSRPAVGGSSSIGPSSGPANGPGLS